MINTVYKYYHYSPKHQLELTKEIQAVYEMAERKFKHTFHTRWLSFEGAVDAVNIVVKYDALGACLEMDMAESEDPVANGLLKFITDNRFLNTSYCPHSAFPARIFRNVTLLCQNCVFSSKLQLALYVQ